MSQLNDPYYPEEYKTCRTCLSFGDPTKAEYCVVCEGHNQWRQAKERDCSNCEDRDKKSVACMGCGEDPLPNWRPRKSRDVKQIREGRHDRPTRTLARCLHGLPKGTKVAVLSKEEVMKAAQGDFVVIHPRGGGPSVLIEPGAYPAFFEQTDAD